MSTVIHIGKHWDFINNTKAPVVASVGGAGSGKTVSICQKFVQRLFDEPAGYVQLIVRKTGPSLTKTTYAEYKKALDEAGHIEGEDYVENRAERSIKTPDGNIVWFFSFGGDVEATRGVEKAKSLNITDCYINEATELSRDEYQQLRLRLRNPTGTGRPNQMFLDFNPTDPYHWTKTEVLDMADGRNIAALHSTYMDNPFLPESYREQLRQLEALDQTYYKIYALGEYAVLKNLIYSNYDVRALERKEQPISIGVDFGFNNPTAVVALYSYDREIYLKTMVYESHLTNQDLINRISTLINKTTPIYADSAEPARIEELRRAGYNVFPADKSVNDGIDRVKRYRLHIHPESTELLKEIRGYKWREDRNGRILDEPVKINDHAMDALRYGIMGFKEAGGNFHIYSGTRRQ